MNKSRNDKNKILNKVLMIIIIILAIFIYSLYVLITYSESVDSSEIYLKDNKYKVLLEQISEDAIFSLNRIRVTVGKKVENEWIYKEPFEMSYAIRGVITKENYTIDWIDGGVIIKVRGVEKEKDMTYRVYWEDVF